MTTPRISASSYSNTAPLVWSFLYGRHHGDVELILDNAPARSAELLATDRVDAALVPVIAYQTIDDVRLIADVCVGARERVRSVCLVTRGQDLENVKTVALDTSSRTSVALTKIIFREFLGFEPVWQDASPNIDAMLAGADAALLIGDPALSLSSPTAGGGVAAPMPFIGTDGVVGGGLRIADLSVSGDESEGQRTAGRGHRSKIKDLRSFDLAELWHKHTGLGFVFAMWMTKRDKVVIDFAQARDEGLNHIDEIVANYASDINIGRDEMRNYLSENISYSVDDSMRQGMELYFDLANKHGLALENKELRFV